MPRRGTTLSPGEWEYHRNMIGIGDRNGIRDRDRDRDRR